MTDQLPALTFLVPLVAAISMPLVGHRRQALCRPVALAAVVAMGALAVASLVAVIAQGTVRYSFSGWAPPLGIEWVADPLAALMVTAVGALVLLSLLYGGSIDDPALARRTVPYHTIVLLLTAGLTGACYAGDLFNIFVFLEVVALAAYALVAVPGGRALVSAFRYLMMGALGTTFYLLGVAYFYAATGSLNIADLAERLPALLESKAVLAGVIFMFLGLAIKMALPPLHGWLPDAYGDAPDAAAPLLAGLVTKVAVLVWVRILFWVIAVAHADHTADIFALVAGVGILSSVGGALLALRQRKLKWMFAYGGIAHVGLVLVGLGLGNQTGLVGSLHYLLNDALMQCGLFLLAGVVAQRYGARSLEEVGRAAIRNPWVVGSLIGLGVGMIGLPPTGGFFAKWYILLGALEAGNHLAAGAVVLTTLLTLAYFARLFELLLRGRREREEPDLGDAPWQLRLALAAPVAGAVALGVLGDRVIGVLAEATGGLGL